MYTLHPTLFEMVAEREVEQIARQAERRRLLDERVHWDDKPGGRMGTIRSLIGSLTRQEGQA